MSNIKEGFKEAAVLVGIPAAAVGVTVGALELALNGVIPVGVGALVWPASAVVAALAVELYSGRSPRVPESRQKTPNDNQHHL